MECQEHPAGMIEIYDVIKIGSESPFAPRVFLLSFRLIKEQGTVTVVVYVGTYPVVKKNKIISMTEQQTVHKVLYFIRLYLTTDADRLLWCE